MTSRILTALAALSLVLAGGWVLAGRAPTTIGTAAAGPAPIPASVPDTTISETPPTLAEEGEVSPWPIDLAWPRYVLTGSTFTITGRCTTSTAAVGVTGFPTATRSGNTVEGELGYHEQLLTGDPHFSFTLQAPSTPTTVWFEVVCAVDTCSDIPTAGGGCLTIPDEYVAEVRFVDVLPDISIPHTL